MKKTKQGTPYSITKKGMAYIYEIEGKGFGGYALTHVSKRKLSESEIDEIGSGNEYKNGGGVDSSKTEFTYSVIVRPKREQYDGVQFEHYAGDKELILADREKFSKEFDFDKNNEGFQKLLKNYADKCYANLSVYESKDMLFPKHYSFDLSEMLDVEINIFLEGFYYIDVKNKDKTSIYNYNDYKNDITMEAEKKVEEIKSNLPPEDSYDITIKVIRMKDGEVVDTQKVLKKDKMPRVIIHWDNVKRVATLEGEDGEKFDLKYKDIIAFIRKELDTPEVIKSRIKMLESVNIKEEAKDNIAKNLPIAIKLNYYLKYKMNYKDGNFNVVRGFAKGGGIENEFLEFTIPTWALPSLINADDSGLEDEDVEKLNKFVDKTQEKYGNANFMLGDKSEETEFYWRNDIDGNLGGDVTTLYLMPTKEYKNGGKLKRSNESLIADGRYNALPEGERKSKKWATIELANGKKIRRRNANQTGEVEGGRYYSEKRPSHTDKEGKAVVSVRKKAIKKSVSVSKPSDSIKFVGINFKRYNYTVGGL
jgi:hypothetical protein